MAYKKPILVAILVAVFLIFSKCQLEIPDENFGDNLLADELAQMERARQEYVPHPGREGHYNNKGGNPNREDKIRQELLNEQRIRDKLLKSGEGVYSEKIEDMQGYESYGDYNQEMNDYNFGSMELDPMMMNGGMPGGMPGDFQNMQRRNNPNDMGMGGDMMGGMNRNQRRPGHPGAGFQNNPKSHSPAQTTSSTMGSPSSWLGSYGGIYEFLMVFFLFGFVFNCICGRSMNDKYAIAWYNANRQYFEERYESIGMKKEEDQLDFKMPEGLPITKESPQVFKFYCANYRYCKWLLAVMEFKKRTDSVTMLTSLFMSTRDRLIYEIAISPVEEIGWMFCVCKKSDAKNLKSTYQDIDFLGKSHDPSIFKDTMTVLAEDVGTFIELFQNKNLLNYYKSVEPYLDVIYYTDQYTFCKEKHALFFSFEVNLNMTKGHERLLLEITHFVNLFSDTLAQVKYSDKIKKDFEKNRVMFERAKMEEAMRQEIEEREKKEFIENWKLKNKLKGKKPKKKVEPAKTN